MFFFLWLPVKDAHCELPSDQKPVHSGFDWGICGLAIPLGCNRQRSVGLWGRHVHRQLHSQCGLVVPAHRDVCNAQDRQGFGLVLAIWKIPITWGRGCHRDCDSHVGNVYLLLTVLTTYVCLKCLVCMENCLKMPSQLGPKFAQCLEMKQASVIWRIETADFKAPALWTFCHHIL